MRVLIAVISISAVGSQVASGQQLLVPSAATPCYRTNGMPFDSRDSLSRAWYGEQISALQEGNLCSEASGADEVFRFVLLPSFHASIAVVIRSEGGRYLARAKKLDGAGGYAAGRLVADTSFSLTPSEWSELAHLVKGSGFFDNRVAPNRMGRDGAQWILEWAGQGKYYFVDRWTPYQNGPAQSFRRVGEWLLRRSGLVADSLLAHY